MSHRGKRPSRCENDGPPPVKRRKGRPPISSGTTATANDEDDAATAQPSAKSAQNSGLGAGTSTSKNWQLRQMNDLKMSSIYNRNAPEAPAELFRKDLISAMKLPDSEPLAHDEYWVIGDQWKQEWERGVQVPVNPDALPEPSVRGIQSSTIYKGRSDFKLPKNKYIRITKDESFSSELHYLSNAPAMADAACSYDLDQCDEAWLKLTNGERVQCGLPPVTEEQFERVVEELETRCWDKIQAIMKSEEGLGIEYDENVICDVCRSPDSEEANEMVFCDNCNICVHQACYGITVIPPGQWMCRTCTVSLRPDCVLCPNKGGAMKSTRSGQKWAHVSCALWIPEVSIGSVDRMEPITKISSIPQSRWALLCVLCRERVGACIQCSVKTCKTAYHVTCAFQHGLEMRAIIEDEHAEDGVKLRSYCLKHSMNKSKRDKNSGSAACGSGSEDDDGKRKKQRKDMTTEERNQARIQRLQEVEADFDKHVNVKDISCHLLEVDQEGIHTIYSYWILKRKSMSNRPLLPPKSEDVDMATHKQGQADVEKMKMFVHLRQDLERVRNLCYMVSRREKLSRSFFKMREQTFHKQMTLLMDLKVKKVDETLVQSILQANHGPSIYDRLYSARQVPVMGQERWDQLVNRLSECERVGRVSDGDEAKVDLNGVKKKAPAGGAAKKQVFNGAAARRASAYGSSLSSDSESSTGRMIREMSKKAGRTPKNADGAKIDRRKRRINSVKRKSLVDTSSEDEDAVKVDKQPRNRTLRQMAREMSNEKSRQSGSDESDELLPIRNSSGQQTRGKMSAIYSDSDSTDREKTDNAASDSQQHVVRTKAAMKEFIPHKGKGDSKSRPPDATAEGGASRKRTKSKTAKQENSNKVTSKVSTSKKDILTDLLVVPQRQAAKKASENLKSTNATVAGGKKEQKDTVVVPAPPAAKIDEPPVVKERRDSVASKEERVTKKKVPKGQTQKIASAKSTEVLAYVPQRQAAKKAAEHIKSGLGKPPTEVPAAAVPVEEPKAVAPKVSPQKKVPPPEDTKKNATPVVISSSSSSYSGSSSSSTSSSSSSSESEVEDAKVEKKTKGVVAAATKNPPANNRARDLPFLDKEPKPLRSATSSSDTSDTDSTDDSSESNNNRNGTTKKVTTVRRVVAEGKLKTSGLGRPGASTADGARAAKVGARSSKRQSVSGDRRRSADGDKQGAPDKVLPGESAATRRRKSTTSGSGEKVPQQSPTKSRADEEKTKSLKSDELSPEKRKTNEKVNATKESPREQSHRKSRTPSEENKVPAVFKSPEKKVDDQMKRDTPSPLKKSTVDEIPVVLSPYNKQPQEPKGDAPCDKREETENRPTSAMEKPKSIFSPLPQSAPPPTSAKTQKDPCAFFDFTDDLLPSVSETINDDGFSVQPPDDSVRSVALPFSHTTDILFKEDYKEDSEKETMNLVEKLRQKFKRTHSTAAASTDEPKEQVPPHVVDVEPVEPKVNDIAASPPRDTSSKRIVDEVEKPAVLDKFDTVAESSQKPEIPVDDRWIPPSDLPPAIAHLSQLMFDPKLMQQNLAQATMEEIVSQSLVAAAGNNADFLKQFQERMEFQTSQCIAAQHQMHQQAAIAADPKPQTPHNKTMEYDESSIQSPYSVHQQNWVESDMIPNRRSVSSSPASSGSEDPKQPQRLGENIMHHRNMLQEMPPFMQHPGIQPFPNVPPADMLPPYNYPETTGGFTGPVTLFPPSGINVQLPFPSPGAAMFPPAFGQSFTTAPAPPTSLCGVGPLQKPDDIHSVSNPTYPANPCGAAFTSSSQNMALTAAMISPTPAPITITSPPPQPPSVHNICHPANLTQHPEQKSETDAMKSPAKRQSRQHQTKSPAKSPAKSPRQQVDRQLSPAATKAQKADPPKPRKVRAPTTAGRGRGRGRGRGAKAGMHHFPPLGVSEFDFMTGGTNHSKLAGTVYDFDDEIGGESVENLKAMRDRRRSIDCRIEPFRSAATSPKFASPNAHSKQSRPIPPPPPFATADIRNLRPPSPVRTETAVTQETPPTTLRDIVQPVLPGPVDMRTYNTGFDASSDAFNNHLLRAFASGTADQTLPDIDEEMEKELQSALKASSTKPKSPAQKVPQGQPPAPPEEFTSELDTSKPKVSLSDSSNQLKLKIKGPLAHPDNYNSQTSTVRHPVTGHPGQMATDPTFPATSTNCTLSTPGASNFHRMRKKELLRQYCSQDMNTVDAHIGAPPNLTMHTTQLGRTVGIPKAVDSMSSIPTKEDYKDYANIDPKKRKKVGGMSRELRQLDIAASYEMNDDDPMRMSFDLDGYAKRRMRGNLGPLGKEMPELPNAVTPKLKIKIGQGVFDVSPQADKRLSGRPPKKRISQNMTMPILEDIKRDHMNFRKLVMADFEEKEKVIKPKKVKPSKEEKRKKKKDKKHKFEIINNGNSDAAPKLIIRFGKRKSEEGPEPQIPQDPYEYDPNAIDPLAMDEPMADKPTLRRKSSANGQEKQITPIRLKISRNQGKSYVMGEGEKTDKDAGNPTDVAPTNCTDAKGKKVAETNLDASKTSSGAKKTASDPPKVPSSSTTNSNDGKKKAGEVTKVPEKESNTKTPEEKQKKVDTKDTDTKGCPALPLNKDCEVR